MSRIRDDLRLEFSQPWAVWALFGGAVGVFCLLVLAEAAGFVGLGMSTTWAILLIFIGMGWGMQDREAPVEAPLSFTLPGYRESLRRLSLPCAVRWGIALSLGLFAFSWERLLRVREMGSRWPSELPVPASPPLAPGILEMCLNLVGGLLAGMAIRLFWTGAPLAQWRPGWLRIPFLGVEIAMGIVVWFFADRYPFVLWPILIPLSIACCVYFWVHLGDMDWVKNGHRAFIVRGIEGPKEIAAQRRPCLWVEELFQGRMRKRGAQAAGRYAWGWLYRRLGPVLTSWKWIAVPLLVAVGVQGYVSRLFVELAFLVFGSLAAVIVLPESSPLLLPLGRREQYRLTIVTAATATLLLIAATTALTALSWLLAALMPAIRLGTHQWQYAGVPIGGLLLACVPVPWVFLLVSLGPRVPVVRGMIPFVVGFPAIGEIFARHYSLYRGPTLLPVLLAGGWVFFLFVVWIKYRRWDLADESPVGDA